MSGPGLAALFRCDLTLLTQELRAIPGDGALWVKPPGLSNSIGNPVLHLEGNLREYIGRQLGGIPYSRQRNLLNNHLNYHLGEIDYLRRILTTGGALDFAQL